MKTIAVVVLVNLCVHLRSDLPGYCREPSLPAVEPVLEAAPVRCILIRGKKVEIEGQMLQSLASSHPPVC